MKAHLIRALTLAVIVSTAFLGVTEAKAQTSNYLQLTSSDILHDRPVRLGVNKSMVIELPRPAGDVLVSNPAIADAVLRTSTRLYLIGAQLGQSNVFVFDANGGQIASFEVNVEPDLSTLNQLLAEAITDGYVRADALNGNIVLRGEVASSSSAARAQEITTGMLQGFQLGESEGAGTLQKQVVNLLTITGEEQVALKVTIAEVQREIVKQLGINISGSYAGDNVIAGTEGFGPLGSIASGVGLSPLVDTGGGEIGVGFSAGSFDIQATMRALDETNMIRTLAEPTLTAISGETADFLAGGEYPYLVYGGDDEPPTVEFKQFGVQLAFTPVVLSGGRINLKVRAEVSEITDESLGQPVLSSRRTETTVELPSGGAFVIGGLVQESTRRAASGFPGLQNLPILGSLFSSKAFQTNETELVMMVTPYLVKPVSPDNLATPDKNMVMAGDAEAYFRNRLTKVYGNADTAPPVHAPARVGFSFD